MSSHPPTPNNSVNTITMYIQKKHHTKQAMPVFMMLGEVEPATSFVAGKCVCKSCKSVELDFYNYLDDAKCCDCGQWQNEDPNPD